MAEAAKVIGVTSTSSPSPMPAANAAPCRAAVPLENATTCAAPRYSASASSKRSTAGPWVISSERSASTTASTSASEISWRPYGRKSAARHRATPAAISRSSSTPSHDWLVSLV